MSLSVEEAPKALDIQTTSGDIDLVLPEDAAFTLDYDAISGDLSSNLPYTMEGERYIFGDGADEYTIGAISGDVRITSGNQSSLFARFYASLPTSLWNPIFKTTQWCGKHLRYSFNAGK